MAVVASRGGVAEDAWDEACDGINKDGGSLSQSGNLLIDPIKKALAESLTFQRVPQIVIAHHGAQAGTIGCAMMALDLLPNGGN